MKVITRSWPEFYVTRNNEEYYNYICEKYNCFIHEIYKSIKLRDTVVEFGCGLSNITRSLIKLCGKSKVYFMISDIHKSMLIMSEENLVRGGISHFDNNKFNYRFQRQDARISSLKGQIAHSHGLLEHFLDNEINEIINLQKDNFRELIHYVPSNKYSQPSFGDERLMSPDQWFDICKPNEIIEFNEGYDLILKWKS